MNREYAAITFFDVILCADSAAVVDRLVIAVTKYDTVYKSFWDSKGQCGDSEVNVKKAITDSVSTATGKMIPEEAIIPVSAILGQHVNHMKRFMLASSNESTLVNDDSDDDDDIYDFVEDVRKHVQMYRYYVQHRGDLKKKSVKDTVRALSERNLLNELKASAGIVAFERR